MPKLSKNTYILPLDVNDIIDTSSDPQTHTDEDEFAIDYEARIGTKVHAAAPGTIIFVKDDSQDGGDHPRFENFKFYNHIIIKHDNGEYTEYGHLKHKGAIKKMGDRVKAFEVIGLSGNTGYSAKPHLHFSVFMLEKVKDNFSSLPKGKKYFINDSELGFQTVEPKGISENK